MDEVDKQDQAAAMCIEKVTTDVHVDDALRNLIQNRNLYKDYMTKTAAQVAKLGQQRAERDAQIRGAMGGNSELRKSAAAVSYTHLTLPTILLV